MSLMPNFLSREARTECGATPAPHATCSRPRVIVLVIVVSAVLGLVLGGQDAANALALVAASGIAAVEIATRLLGAPATAGTPS
jgi:hypothetical protein